MLKIIVPLVTPFLLIALMFVTSATYLSQQKTHTRLTEIGCQMGLSDKFGATYCSWVNRGN